ncbi:LicD family protein [Agromyces cerinus]|uniref:LicD family protein n=1 Tax=Agromyces cerinus subsp. cerinus TaxID=232089 RepID=A0A1N6DIG7_9MICO|nr:methyltransferase domain-containing protein [Agromyces cerinus]SIN70517.1 LicD family protein [Agromyces cerinus subsp. cerinus]
MSSSKRVFRIDPALLDGIGTVDVLFDGRRVWSVGVDEIADGRLVWPKSLRPYFDGRTEVSIRNSANSEELVTDELRFGRSERRIDLRDAAGRPLAMNKWQRLGPVFEGGNVRLRERLLENAQSLVALLERDGFNVYIVGGSLLGYMRTGGLLPHDDDIDLAFLSEHSHPADIALDSYRMENALVRAGMTVVRHSLAHLEIDFFDDQGHVEHYVDIFTGYFRDGLYCQPFALRGPEVTPDDLLPVQRVEVDGVALPAPKRPEAWLEYAYGPNWLVPDPSFVFDTSQWTRRRFENNFGVYNRARVYWEKRYLSLDGVQPKAADPDSVIAWAEGLPADAAVLDLGCGTGESTNLIASTGRRVLGIDFSHEALSIASANAEPGASFAYTNFNDGHGLFALGASLLATGDVWHVRIADTIHGITLANRHAIFSFLELVLRGGAVAWGTTYTDLPGWFERSDPTSWHYPPEWLEAEISDHALSVEFVSTARRETPQGRREQLEFVIRSTRTRPTTDNGDD